MKNAKTFKLICSLIGYILFYVMIGFLIIRYNRSIHWIIFPVVFIILAAQFLPLWTTLTLEAICIVSSLTIISLLLSNFQNGFLTVAITTLVLTPFIFLIHTFGTRKKRTDQQLKDNLERIQYAFEDTQDGIWDWKPNIKELYLSPGLNNLLGIKSSVYLDDETLTQLIHPEDLKSIVQKFQAHYLHQAPDIQIEIRLKNREKNWMWFLLRGKVTERNSDNQPTRVTGTVFDIAEQKKIKQTLKESETIFRQVSDNIREVYWLRDRKTRQLIYIKLDEHIKTMEDTNDEIRYSTPDYYYKNIHPDDQQIVREYENELYENGKPFIQDYRFFHQDGTIHWLMCRQYPILDEKGNFHQIIGVAEDITERKHFELALQQSEKRFRDMVEHQGEGVIIVDTEENFIYTNPAAGEIFGVPHNLLIGRRWHEFLEPKQLEIVFAQTENRRKGIESSYELVIQRPDGQKRNILATVTPRLDEKGQFIGGIGVVRDITERHNEIEHLRYQSTHDPLTHLHNRTFFENELYRLESSDQYPISIIMIDMDGLKKINDHFGHAEGDTQLIRTAQLLKNSFREEDIITRIGGDEFAILMPNTDQETLDKIIRRLRENIFTENQQPNAYYYPIEISIGGEVCATPGPLKNTLKRADTQMYLDKSRTRPRPQ